MESNRLTIIVNDNAVYRDQGVMMGLDLSSCNIPEGAHALQWMTDSGHIEFTGPVPNENITVLPQWALDCVQVWETAYQAMIDQQNQPDPAPEEPI